MDRALLENIPRLKFSNDPTATYNHIQLEHSGNYESRQYPSLRYWRSCVPSTQFGVRSISPWTLLSPNLLGTKTYKLCLSELDKQACQIYISRAAVHQQVTSASKSLPPFLTHHYLCSFTANPEGLESKRQSGR